MKRINLTSYGFRRAAHEDFTDDGSYFFAYRIGKIIRVSKCLYAGEVYLSARAEDPNNNLVDYDVYSKLPHYKYLDQFNGYSVERLTEQDLKDFANNCLEYEKEYIQAQLEAILTMPTYNEVVQKCKELTDFYQKEYDDVVNEVTKAGVKILTNLSGYELAELRDITIKLSKIIDPNSNYSYRPDAYCNKPGELVCNRRVLNLMKEEPKESHWHKQAREYIAKAVA